MVLNMFRTELNKTQSLAYIIHHLVFFFKMNSKLVKILLILLSVVYLLSFLEVDESERNQNYGNEDHSYIIISCDAVTAKIIPGSISKCFSPVIIPQGIDDFTSVFKLSFTNNYSAHLYYPSNKIYLSNSVFLI